MRAVAAYDPRLAVQKVGPQLHHAEAALRLGAAEALSAVSLEEAAQALLSRMSAPEFVDETRAARAVFFEALGRQHTQVGLRFLHEKLQSPPRAAAQRARGVEEQLLAVRGLAEEASLRTLRVLEHAAHPDEGHPAVVVSACRAAASHVRELLARAAERR